MLNKWREARQIKAEQHRLEREVKKEQVQKALEARMQQKIKLRDKKLAATDAKQDNIAYVKLLEKEIRAGEEKATPRQKEYLQVSTMLRDLSEITDFFQYSMNPSELTDFVTNMVNYKMGKKEKQALVWFIGAGIAVLLICIGGYFLLGAIKTPDCASMCQAGVDCLTNAAHIVHGNTPASIV